jgi:putative SOS response-associated peptidase YedK
MCGRAVQAKAVIPLAVFSGIDVPDSRVANVPLRYNAAPSQELWVIRQNRDTSERSLDLLKWGLIPYRCKETPHGRSLGMGPIVSLFRAAWRRPLPSCRSSR